LDAVPAVTGTVSFLITSQKIPLKTNNPPSVMMNAGMRKPVISFPIKDQTTIPKMSPIAMASGAGKCCLKTKTLAMPPINPTPLPTERSIIPGSKTKSIPNASVAVTASSMERSERLRAPKNLSVDNANEIQIRINAMPIEKSRIENLVWI
jgi:hypothetical protein